MPRAGVLGWPVEHSRSPAMHNAAYAALGLTDWSYRAVAWVYAHDAGVLPERPEAPPLGGH